MARSIHPVEEYEASLPDSELWDLPRRMTRREGTLSAGSDRLWTQPCFEEEETHD
jgi:hypothetical protein